MTHNTNSLDELLEICAVPAIDESRFRETAQGQLIAEAVKTIAVTETTYDGKAGMVPPDRRRSIMILVENLPVPYDRRVWQEATSLRQAGHRVTVICPKGKDYEASEEMLEGVQIYRYPLPIEAQGALAYFVEYGSALTFQLLLAIRVLFLRGFDVIQACNPPDLLFLVAAPFKLLGKKFIFDHHDLFPELFEVKFGAGSFLHRMTLRAERATFWLADGVISTNEGFRQIAISRGHKRPEDVRVVLSAPDPKRLYRVEPDQSLKVGRRFCIFYIGVMGSQDGVDLMLKAARAIVDRGRTDMQFLLVGDGPEYADLVATTTQMGLDHFVTFTGRQSGEILCRSFSSADIGVCPDPKNESNDRLAMNKVMEYMSFGLPVVQFSLTENMRLVGEAGLNVGSDNDPVKMADAIIQLCDDDALRQKLGAEGMRRMAEELTWERQVPNLLEAYDKLWP